MVENHSKWWSFVLFGAGAVIAFIASVLVKEDLKKSKLDLNKDEEQTSKLLEDNDT